MKELSCFEPELLLGEEDLVDGILDMALLKDNPVVLHPRQERKMDEDYYKLEEAQNLSRAKEEDAQLEEHAFQTALLIQNSQVKYAKHDFLSLRTPVIADKELPRLTKSYAYKSTSGCLDQVISETMIERQQLTNLYMQATQQINQLDKRVAKLRAEEEL